ncbi:MAG TPA: hypothetical protein V6D47_06250, partial [Oscillatoriaceae cyanobacterium]
MRDSLARYLTPPRLLQLALDMCVSVFAFYWAYFLRFEGHIPAHYLHQFLDYLPLMLGLRFVWRFPAGLHQQLWRYVSLREAFDIALTITVGTGFFIILTHYAFQAHVPWGVLAIDWGVNLIGYLGLRAVKRMYNENQ